MARGEGSQGSRSGKVKRGPAAYCGLARDSPDAQSKGMAWRIDEQLVRGEIDNRVRGRVTGRLWFLGRAEPVILDLRGDAWRDVAGHFIRFTNPGPKPGASDALAGFATVQRGVVGDITASRRVKVPDCPMEEVLRLVRAGKRFPWHWGNSLYLEWHGEQNGRVVIESAAYRIEIDPDAAWRMSAAEERAQREANEHAARESIERMAEAISMSSLETPEDPDEDDTPQSAAEAAADAEQARMDLLLDRVQARMERERAAGRDPDLAQVMDEERARLRRERGEPDPAPLSPEEEAERAEWIAEMNAAAEEALDASAADAWNDEGFRDERWHPLVERCNALTHRLRDQSHARGWLGDDDIEEHPLRAVMDGVMIAGGKLAGALGTLDDASDWPPDPLCAGSTLTRLKKARGHLRDALGGLDVADEQDLADAEWRREAREEIEDILSEVRRLISEVRAVLKLSEEG
jgi:hypothetical protein